MSNLFRLPYLQRYRDRHGRDRTYYRHGSYRVALPDGPAQEGFFSAYEAARENDPSLVQGRDALRQERRVSVYVISGPLGVKIGVSLDPEQRASGLQTGSAAAVRVVGSRDVSSRAEAMKLERSLHEKFAANRMVGEWFALPEREALDALAAA